MEYGTRQTQVLFPTLYYSRAACLNLDFIDLKNSEIILSHKFNVMIKWDNAKKGYGTMLYLWINIYYITIVGWYIHSLSIFIFIKKQANNKYKSLTKILK